MNIALTGFMGTGKSSVGRKLASRLSLGYADTDDLIEEKAKMSVKDIFLRHGEYFFRDIEKEVISAFTRSRRGAVLCTGGGAVIDESTRKRLRKWGAVICLTASFETILKRVGDGDERPLLNRPDRKAFIQELMKKRERAYKDCDLMVDTTGKNAEEVTGEIIGFLASKGKGG